MIIGFCNSYRITERVPEIDAMLMNSKQVSEPEVGRFLYFDCNKSCVYLNFRHHGVEVGYHQEEDL